MIRPGEGGGFEQSQRSGAGGVHGEENWEARRQKRVHGGVGGQVYVGVPLRWSGRRGGKAIITQ